MQDYSFIYNQFYLEFRAAMNSKDERKQLKLFDKALKYIDLSKFDNLTKARYCRLLRLKGSVKKSTQILERIVRESNYRADDSIKWELLCNYMYENDTDKAEDLLLSMMKSYIKQAKNNKNSSFSSHFLEDSRYGLVLFAIAREKDQAYPEVEDYKLSYYSNQIKKYDLSKLRSYMSSYFNQKENLHGVFAPSISKDEIIKKTQRFMEEEDVIRSTDSYAVDVYYLDFNEIIGKDKEKKDVTGVRVVTIKNTQDLLCIEPCDVKDTTKFRIVNKRPVMKDKTLEKVYNRPSQIEKFNRRYNKKES